MGRKRPYWAEEPCRIFADPETIELKIVPPSVEVRDKSGWQPVRLRADGCFNLDVGSQPNGGAEFRLRPGRIDFVAGESRGLFQPQRQRQHRPLIATEPTRIQLAAATHNWRVNQVSTDVSLRLLEQAGRVARGTQRRMVTTFTIYVIMLGLMFTVGIAGFAVALYNALILRSGASTTALFCGLSAISFVTFFLAQPSQAVDRLGPRTAWILAMVNTYWTKLAYFNDPKTIVTGLNEAEKYLTSGIQTYLKTDPPSSRWPARKQVQASQEAFEKQLAKERVAELAAQAKRTSDTKKAKPGAAEDSPKEKAKKKGSSGIDRGKVSERRSGKGKKTNHGDAGDTRGGLSSEMPSSGTDDSAPPRTEPTQEGAPRDQVQPQNDIVGAEQNGNGSNPGGI